MPRKIYIGADDVSHKVSEAYIGIEDMARKIIKGYIGVGGVARLFWDCTNPMLDAGLYDSNDNLIVDWDTLVNTYGLNIEKNYSSSPYNENYYKTTPGSAYYVFSNWSQLSEGKKLVISNNIINIGEESFYECPLSNIIIGGYTLSIGYQAFSGCAMNTMTIGNAVRAIDENAFAGCRSLTDITIGLSVEYIGDGAFDYCWSLKRVIFPSSIKTIESGAFFYCTKLEEVIFRGKPAVIGTNEDPVFSYCNKLTNIYVPWSEGEVPGAPWGATKATIHYNTEVWT